MYVRRVSPRHMSSVRMWAWIWASACLSTATPTTSFISRSEESPGTSVVNVLNRMVQVLETQERHTALYERVALLEETLSKKTETEMRLESELLQLRAKIPALEEEINTIPEMKKALAEFEAKIEKLVHDYEAKLSTLASEVIRLKKYGARRKDFQTLSDGSNMLLSRAPSCPEVGLGLVAERVGEQCLYFSLGSQLNWTAAHRHCQELGGDLAAPQDLVPLKTFLHQAFIRGPSLWLGASYDLDDADTAAVDVSDAVSLLPPNQSLQNLPQNIGNSESAQDIVVESEPPCEPQDNNEDDFPSGLKPAVMSEHIHPMLLDEGHSDVDDNDLGEIAGATGSLRRILEQVAMFNENFSGDNGRITLPRRVLNPRENALSKSTGRDAAKDLLMDRIRLSLPVVDVILLPEQAENSAPSPEALNDQNLPEYSNLEERSISGNINLTDISLEGPTAPPGDTSDERAVPGDEGEGQEAGSSEAQGAGTSKGARKARMKCMLLQQKESLEYELIGRPCDELHTFVCDMKFSFNLLHE
ncbi:uncharacterized protein LOC121853899 [Homarus americanus]|uniref:Uncharacterized protein n=1 Tax=Homarus americanus TaxID=6706 RepID=A0A8J5JHV8_HOMAM|nr:uncharacterized protein LOC121853899 [Homarus americanus]XP_042204219.1 uncharacterized protein LOC121853899 [Homarus americanus]XP_042204220.1 uncharacterized protein LOC121853899 [Homarus americanus]XP_042204221.1 uncharacterized protein LOC121853899 [Homarus americanus]XP_042204222.1 uncharacterized protein LOC121853899 [Homarus americanus]XP_042204223.1 uncharacterized protein LOC121853899 [Homarus americanus]XP_042204225.1 uncharacterized protein LOC121853899 [Homarus americanus]XP_0